MQKYDLLNDFQSIVLFKNSCLKIPGGMPTLKAIYPMTCSDWKLPAEQTEPNKIIAGPTVQIQESCELELS